MNGARSKEEFVACVFFLHLMLALHRRGELVFLDGLPEARVVPLTKYLNELPKYVPSLDALRPLLPFDQLAMLEEAIAYGFL